MLSILLRFRKNETRVISTIVLIIANRATLTGCTISYGKIKKSGEVNLIFKSYQVLPDYHYYYSGSRGRPDAIMGIHRDYTLQTIQGIQIDFTDNPRQKWGQYFNSDYGTHTSYHPYGFQILDHEGNSVGI